MTFKVTMYPRANVVAPTGEYEYNTLLELFEKEFKEYKVRKEKAACTMFSPVTLFPNTTRRQDNVKDIQLLVLDYDGVSDEAMLGAQLWCQGKEAFIYTTYSHSIKEGNSFRVVALPTRSFSVIEFPSIFKGFEDMVGIGASDNTCIKDYSKAYFTSWTDVVTPEMFCTFFGGTPIDIDECAELGVHLIESPTHFQVPDRNVAIDAGLIKIHAKKLSRSPVIKKQIMSRQLTTLIKGLPLAEKERHGLCIALAAHLVVCFPEATEDSILALFQDSYNAMASDDWEPEARMHDLHRSIVSATVKYRQTALDEAHKKQNTLQTAIEEALGEGGEAYTDRDINQWANDSNTIPDNILRAWIVFKGKSIYVRKGDTYTGPFDISDVWARLRDDLSPAQAYVQTKTMTKDGMRDKSIRQLQEEYGTTVQNVVFDWCIKDTKIDFRKSNLCIGLRRESPLTATKHDIVDAWLDEMVGEDADTLRHWLALSLDLSRPLSMLYLEGSSQAGKGLLVASLPKLWGCHEIIKATDWTESFSDFRKSPVIHIDEQLPKAWKGNDGFDALKHEIQSRERDKRPIFKAPIKLNGCLRFIATANDSLIKKFDYELNKANEVAITARFTNIKVLDRGAEYLKDFSEEELDIMRDQLIPEHILWLAEQDYKREGTYGIDGANNDFAKQLKWKYSVNQGIASFLIMFLGGPEEYYKQRNAMEGLVVEDGHIFVSTRAFLQHWRLYVNNIRIPGADEIVRSLKGMGTQVKRGKTTMYRIDNDKLKEYGEISGMMTAESFEQEIMEAQLLSQGKEMEATADELRADLYRESN